MVIDGKDSICHGGSFARQTVRQLYKVNIDGKDWFGIFEIMYSANKEDFWIIIQRFGYSFHDEAGPEERECFSESEACRIRELIIKYFSLDSLLNLAHVDGLNRAGIAFQDRWILIK